MVRWVGVGVWDDGGEAAGGFGGKQVEFDDTIQAVTLDRENVRIKAEVWVCHMLKKCSRSICSRIVQESCPY